MPHPNPADRQPEASDPVARRAVMALCGQARPEELHRALAQLGAAEGPKICARPRPAW